MIARGRSAARSPVTGLEPVVIEGAEGPVTRLAQPLKHQEFVAALGRIGGDRNGDVQPFFDAPLLPEHDRHIDSIIADPQGPEPPDRLAPGRLFDLLPWVLLR